MRCSTAFALLALSMGACTAGTEDVDASLMDGSIPAEGGVMCAADFECDDRVACTIDRCLETGCDHRPCIDCCDEGLSCVAGFGCRTAPRPCTDDAECGDDARCTLDFCSSAGTCESRPQNELCGEGEICLAAAGCIPEPPTTCESEADCEGAAVCVGEWSCQPEFGCQFVALRDCDDGDACTADSCGEGVGCVNEPIDVDGDGHSPAGCGDDCDDGDASVSPSATEVCDGDDEDCDGLVDEGCCPAGEPCTSACGTPSVTVCEGGAPSCPPPAEVCGGGDEDCDERVDEGFACSPGESTACTTSCGSAGTRLCLGDCSFDGCAPPAEVCNGVDDDCDTACDDGFACCEGADRDCTALGYFAGTATCMAGCGGYDESGCTNCGDGDVDSGEQCDGADLGGQGCADLGMGFGSGALSCGAGCRYDTSQCSRCGNGAIDAGEQCDGALLGGQGCTDRGYDGGSLGCTPGCQYDESACTIWDPSGFYSAAPPYQYSCALGLVSLDISSFTFEDDGSVLRVPASFCDGADPYMRGASAETPGRDFDVCCMFTGSCNETYCLRGAFTDDDTWTATFTATFVGAGPDDCSFFGSDHCIDQSVSFTGTR